MTYPRDLALQAIQTAFAPFACGAGWTIFGDAIQFRVVTQDGEPILAGHTLEERVWSDREVLDDTIYWLREAVRQHTGQELLPWRSPDPPED